MKKHITTLFFILIAVCSFGQKKSKAERYFEKGDFLNAAKCYEKDLEIENNRKQIENIAICYYNTFQYKSAEMYLKKIVNGSFKEPDKSYDNKFNFMYYHVLSALDKYESAIDYLKLYNDNQEKEFNKKAAIETVEEFKLKNSDFKIKLAAINSEAADFGATQFKDTLYFTSDRSALNSSKKYKWTHRSFLDIYTATKNEKDTVYQIQNFSKTINTKLHEGNFCFSADAKTLYFSRSNITKGKTQFDKKKSNNVHIYKSTKVKNKWSEPVKMAFNKIGYSYQHPAISPDGKKLYFSSNQEGGKGSFDLYFVDLEDGLADTPVNLGDKINTENREHFPFIDAQGNLFFSSDGHLGLGMLDVFACENKNNQFDTPINLGVPINSAYDDFSLNYHDKTNGYFSSNRKNTNDNVYQFNQTGEIFVREYIASFEIRDKQTNAYIANTKAVLTSKKGAEVYANTLDSLSVFNLTLHAGRYHLKASHVNYQSNEITVNVLEVNNQKFVLLLDKKTVETPASENTATPELAQNNSPVVLTEQKKEAKNKMLQDKKGPPIVEKNGKMYFELEPIYFDYDKWNIRVDSKKILDALAEKMERYPEIHLKISSHTDNRGTDVYNQILSEKRAQSTRSYLALEGYVHARRLQFQGYGESKLKENCLENCTEIQHQLNRRSEFEIISY